MIGRNKKELQRIKTNSRKEVVVIEEEKDTNSEENDGSIELQDPPEQQIQEVIEIEEVKHEDS
jgi:hypothetical protein